MATPANPVDVTLNEAGPDATQITEILDSIPGAWEKTQEGMKQAERGEGVHLDDFCLVDGQIIVTPPQRRAT